MRHGQAAPSPRLPLPRLFSGAPLRPILLDFSGWSGFRGLILYNIFFPIQNGNEGFSGLMKNENGLGLGFGLEK